MKESGVCIGVGRTYNKHLQFKVATMRVCKNTQIEATILIPAAFVSYDL